MIMGNKKFFCFVCLPVLFIVATTISMFVAVKNTNDKGEVEFGKQKQKQKEEPRIKRLYCFDENTDKKELYKLIVEKGKKAWYIES